VIEPSATHIYESALPLSPLSSLVQARYMDQTSTDVKIGGIEDSWDVCTRTIRSHKNVEPERFSLRRRFVTFSQKDDRIANWADRVVKIFETVDGTTSNHVDDQ
jgi:hypothetical protein